MSQTHTDSIAHPPHSGAPITEATGEHIVFVGGGNMTRAIVAGLLRARSHKKAGNADSADSAPTSTQISIVQPRNPKRDQLAQDFGEHGIQVVVAPADLSTPATIVVWSVKPQVLKAVAQVEAHHFNKDALHLSIAAGVPTVSIADWVQNQRVVRAMPNTPAMVGQGATGLFATDAVDAADRDKVTALLRHTGLCLWVEQEHLLEAVTAVSGSGPAYMFYILDAMVKGGVALGLTASVAKELAMATMTGAAALAQQSSETPATLRQNVTSKGGATAEAVRVFDEAHLDNTLQKGMQACAARAREMGQLFI